MEKINSLNKDFYYVVKVILQHSFTALMIVVNTLDLVDTAVAVPITNAPVFEYNTKH